MPLVKSTSQLLSTFPAGQFQGSVTAASLIVETHVYRVDPVLVRLAWGIVERFLLPP
jgi:hypothetical protein